MLVKQANKQTVKAQHPDAFLTSPNHDDHVVWNHGRINQGGYVELGRGKTPSLAWKDAARRLVA